MNDFVDLMTGKRDAEEAGAHELYGFIAEMLLRMLCLSQTEDDSQAEYRGGCYTGILVRGCRMIMLLKHFGPVEVQLAVEMQLA